MAYLPLSKKSFKSIITELVNRINDAQGEGYYIVNFDKDLEHARIKRKAGGAFHLTYMDEFSAIAHLYGCGMWIETELMTNDLVLTIMKN